MQWEGNLMANDGGRRGGRATGHLGTAGGDQDDRADSRRATLERRTFATSRSLEFFSEKELSMQIGHPLLVWPVALVKEADDNSLDACENAGIPPCIEIVVEPDAVSLRDNGSGIPAGTLKRSLDYTVRVSDKSYYVSPDPRAVGERAEVHVGGTLRGRRQPARPG
jgi:hypothetical protein